MNISLQFEIKLQVSSIVMGFHSVKNVPHVTFGKT